MADTIYCINIIREGWISNTKTRSFVKRIIEASSKPGDIVLDCFAGSGTTAAVCEKIKDKNDKSAPRKWILCDSSKLAIYTIIKRFLELKEELGNKGKRKLNSLSVPQQLFYPYELVPSSFEMRIADSYLFGWGKNFGLWKDKSKNYLINRELGMGIASV